MSAFGYFGSKLRIAAKMHDKLPPHNAWIELFCGSAAMTLAKKPAPIEVINDIDGDIVNFYEQLRDNGEELLQKITLTPYARAELELSRTVAQNISKIERARRFFVAAMMAVNGSFGAAKGGFSISNSYSRNGTEARVNRWNRMPDYLRSVVDRLKPIRIENKDALKLFSEFRNRPATLVYLDPPYLGKRVQGYDHDQNSEEFHEKLLNVALTAKCMIFISGYDSDLYSDLLTERNGWEKETIRAITKGNNGKCFDRKEVIWSNSVYCEALRTRQLPLSLGKKEQKDRKLNPTR
jgi:DNA adenine methylase